MSNQTVVKQMHDAVSVIANTVNPPVAYVLITEAKEKDQDIIYIFSNGNKSLGMGMLYRALHLFRDFVNIKKGDKDEKSSEKEKIEKSNAEVQNS